MHGFQWGLADGCKSERRFRGFNFSPSSFKDGDPTIQRDEERVGIPAGTHGLSAVAQVNGRKVSQLSKDGSSVRRRYRRMRPRQTKQAKQIHTGR
jgi:hypothetical protein